MKVFDFRLRPPLKSFLQCDFYNYTSSPFAWHSAPPASFKERSFSTLKRELADAGVVHAAVWGRTIHDPGKSSTNDDVAAIVHEHSDLFVAGFGGMCPRAGDLGQTLTEIEHSVGKLGLKGMTLEPSLGMQPMTNADDPILYPI